MDLTKITGGAQTEFKSANSFNDVINDNNVDKSYYDDIIDTPSGRTGTGRGNGGTRTNGTTVSTGRGNGGTRTNGTTVSTGRGNGGSTRPSDFTFAGGNSLEAKMLQEAENWKAEKREGNPDVIPNHDNSSSNGSSAVNTTKKKLPILPIVAAVVLYFIIKK